MTRSGRLGPHPGVSPGPTGVCFSVCGSLGLVFV
nr:MAG TPA: hypothetical protein [Caudoviricetes sp.]